jgi:hypothetical protein
MRDQLLTQADLIKQAGEEKTRTLPGPSEEQYKALVRATKREAETLGQELEKLALPLLSQTQKVYSQAIDLLRNQAGELDKLERLYPWQSFQPWGPALFAARNLYRFMESAYRGNGAVLTRAGCNLDIWEGQADARRLTGLAPVSPKHYKGDEPEPEERAAADGDYQKIIVDATRKAEGLAKMILELRAQAKDISSQTQGRIAEARKANSLLSAVGFRTNLSLEITGVCDVIIRAIGRT